MLNEHDIKDYSDEFSEYQPEQKEQKLYDLPRGSYYKILGCNDLIKLHNLDGMYSYNTLATGEHKGEVVHIAAYSPVVRWLKGEANA